MKKLLHPERYTERAPLGTIPWGKAVREHRRGRRFKAYRNAERAKVRAAKESELRK
jgi:hypothetical protein